MEVGTDIIEIYRIKEAINTLGQTFLNRVFTKVEQEYCESKHQAKFQHYAGRFAAKEAIFKTLDDDSKHSISWTDIEIINDTTGKPFVKLPVVISPVSVSISHCKEYATAVAIRM